MQSLKFSRLLVLSNSEKSANQFEFSKTLNLITANDNSVGKSTLLKLIFWTFGCEPEFDTTWKSKDCTAVVEFEIANKLYKIKRYKNQVTLVEPNSEIYSFDKITGEYSKKIAEIFQFKALLPNQSTNELETPPPAYYFIPFYIDQKRSWSTAWNNFENLGQYRGWKETIIKYHIGLLAPEHFDIEIEKSDKKFSQNIVKKEIDKIETAIEIVSTYIPESLTTVTSVNELQILTESIKIDLLKLQEEQEEQEELLENIALNNSELSHLNHQKEITEKIIIELDSDYRFTIENIPDDEVECPLCGTIHENSIINRASILVDKSQAETQLFELKKAIEKTQNKISRSNLKLIQVKDRIDDINSKYVIENKSDKKINFNQIIESIAGNSIKENVEKTKIEKVNAVHEIENEIKQLKAEQKNLITKEIVEDRNETFISLFTDYLKELAYSSINLSEINSPLDYNKVIREGGAAEGTRGILAYYLSVYKMVEKYQNEIFAPLVIDTPNQQEQSGTNYEKIVTLLLNKFGNGQVFIGAMENDFLKPLKSKSKVITLDTNRILIKTEYEKIKNYIESI